MSMKLSYLIADFFIAQNRIKEEEKMIYVVGMDVLLSSSWQIILVLFFGIWRSRFTEAVVYLLGEQDNENLTINCKSTEISLQRGEKYTVITMEKPESEEVGIQMVSTKPMDVNAYLIVEYELILSALALEPEGMFESFSGDIVRFPERMPEQPDWFFWGVMVGFVIAIVGLFLVYIRSKGRSPVRKK